MFKWHHEVIHSQKIRPVESTDQAIRANIKSDRLPACITPEGLVIFQDPEYYDNLLVVGKDTVESWEIQLCEECGELEPLNDNNLCETCEAGFEEE